MSNTGGGGNYNFPRRLNITVLFAAALFLAAVFFVTYSEPNESDAAVTWNVEGNVLTISGSGDMDDYYYYYSDESSVWTSDKPWESCKENIESVIIEPGVTSIGDSAFAGCSSLTSVTIPESVTAIGDSAFWYCTSLESITIPESVISIGYGVFSECTRLESVTIYTVTETMFANVKSLKNVTILGNVTSIGSYAFQGAGLTSITIPESVTAIGSYAFSGCTGLTSITIPESVTAIGDGAFSGCTGLTTINIPSSVTSLSSSIFYNCTKLESITIPDSVKTISTNAFYNCTGLTSVTVTGGLVNGNIIENGIIDTYFEKDAANDWKLPGASSAVTSLTLKNIGSTEYDHGNIGGDTGRELCYSDAKYEWAGTSWSLVSCSVSGTLTVTGGSEDSKGVTVSLGTSGLYTAVTDDDGSYTILNVPYGTAGDIVATLSGHSQTVSPDHIDSLTGPLYGQNITLTVLYTVTLTEGDGISGFTYTVNGVTHDTVPFTVNHGDTLAVTALLSEEYAFVSWSGDSDSKTNPLIISYVSGPVNLTANGELIEHYVTFGSGSNYTVYANGSPVSSASSAVGVTGGGSLSFSVRTAEGYSAVPVINGIAYLTAQGDGSYVISEIHSNVKVSVTVSPYSISDPDGDGNGSGNSSGNSSGNGEGSGDGNNSAGDSSDGIPYWIPVLAVAAFLACIAAAAVGIVILKRRKD